MLTGSLALIVACIPAYNEEHRIAAVIAKTKKMVDQVIVCDDGSNDLSGEIAREMGVIVVTHEENSGYGAAIISLFSKALEIGADIIVTIDSDSQHNPEDIHRLVAPLVNGDADIVIGSRFVEGGGADMPGWRKTGIDVINMVSSNGSGVKDTQSGFRAYNGDILSKLRLSEEGMGVSTEILIKATELGAKIVEVPITVNYYEDSSTHNPVFHGLSVVLTSVKHLSIKNPLLFYGLPGGLSLLVSAFFWFLTIQMYTSTRTFSTNVALTAVATTLIGTILMTTAILLWVLISVIREKI